MKKKPRQDEDADEPQPVTIGSYQAGQKTGQAKTARIGFIRQKKKKKSPDRR